MTDWRTIAANTATSQLDIYVQPTKFPQSIRSVNNYDPDWMLKLSDEAKRITGYIRAMKVERDIEVVFKTQPAYHGGWEIDYASRAIRIEIFTHDKVRGKSGGELRNMDWLLFVVRHEFGHAFHDMFMKGTANSWKPITREHFADAFAIKFGSDVSQIYRWRDPKTAVGKRYIKAVEAISVPMDKFITNRLKAEETDDAKERYDYLNEAGIAWMKLQSFIPQEKTEEQKKAAKVAAAKRKEKKRERQAQGLIKPDWTPVRVVDMRNFNTLVPKD